MHKYLKQELQGYKRNLKKKLKKATSVAQCI